MSENTLLQPEIEKEIDFVERIDPNDSTITHFIEVAITFKNQENSHIVLVSRPEFEKYCIANDCMTLKYEETNLETGYTSSYTMKPSFDQFLNDLDYREELRKVLFPYVRRIVRNQSAEERLWKANIILSRENLSLIARVKELEELLGKAGLSQIKKVG